MTWRTDGLRSQIPRLDQDWLPVFSKKITWAHIPYLQRRAEPSGIYQALSLILSETCLGDFPGGPVVKDLPSNAENISLIPGQGTKIPTCPRATKSMRYKEELVCHTKGKKTEEIRLLTMHFSESAPGVDIWKPESQFNNELIFTTWDYIHISLLIYQVWLLNLLNSEFWSLRCEIQLSCLWCQVSLSQLLLVSRHSCSSICRLQGSLEINTFALIFWSALELLFQFHLLIASPMHILSAIG